MPPVAVDAPDGTDQPPPHDSLARLYAVGVQCIATSLSFFLTVVVKLPVPLYFPLLRRWSVVPNSEELAMDFYGRSLLALLVGAVAGLLTLVVFRLHARLARPPASAAPALTPGAPAADSGLTLLTVYAATALVLSGGVFAYQLYGRPPAPEPLPPGLSTLQAAQKPSTLPAKAERRLVPAERTALPGSGSDDSQSPPSPANPASPDSAQSPSPIPIPTDRP